LEYSADLVKAKVMKDRMIVVHLLKYSAMWAVYRRDVYLAGYYIYVYHICPV